MRNLISTAFWALLITLSLFPVGSALAGSVTTDYVTWETNIPYAAPVTTTTLAGTGGAAIANPWYGLGGFSSVYMNAGSGMIYSSDGTMLCVVADGVSLPTAYFYMEAMTDNVAFQLSGSGAVAFYDSTRASVTEGFVISTGFVGASNVADTDLFFVQGSSVTDTICVGPFYLVEDADGDGMAGDIDCDEVDNDLDGSDACSDCDDTDATIYPAASESCDGVDEACDGLGNEVDSDLDSYLACEECDDTDPAVNPDEVEADCDGVDNDCDGFIDEDDPGSTCYDDDGDGLSENDGDCDDADASIYPGAVELCNGLDEACDGLGNEVDADSDGYLACAECDDTDPAVNPGQSEVDCDGVDNDCDGSTDEDDPGSSCYDDDGDGLSENDGDCDDADANVYPGAPELCNGLDEDCNGLGNEVDNDVDGYLACEECDDADAGVNPGAYDVPGDGIDQDCDGSDATIPGDDDDDSGGDDDSASTDDDDSGDDDTSPPDDDDDITPGDDDSGDDDSGDDDSATPDDDDSGDDDTSPPDDDVTPDDDDTTPPDDDDGVIVENPDNLISGSGCTCQSGPAFTWKRGLAWSMIVAVLGVYILSKRRK